MSPEQAEALCRLDRTALAEAAQHFDGHDALRTRLWLDKRYPSDLSLAILDCLATRRQHARKFETPQRWLLHREAAEQATASRLARWRSDYLKSRFPQEKRLLELGTGLGGDSVYLARRFELQGYELDEARAMLARANLAELSPDAAPALIEHRHVELANLGQGLLFADPARRGPKRQFDPEQWNPPLSGLLALARPMALKTAPGLDLGLLPDAMEVHFLSLEGELKEAMLLRPNPGGTSPTRHAWVWPAGSPVPLHREGQVAPVPVVEPAVGEFLHNPDPALLRSGLLAGLAAELEAGVVHPLIGYLAGAKPCPDAWATSFRVLDSLPFHWKSLSEALLATDWSEMEFLSRGVPFSQEEVLTRTRQARKRMKGRAGGRGAVIVYRGDVGYRMLLAQRQTEAQDRS